MSRLEGGLGHEKFRCERCGQLWKLIPEKTGDTRVARVSV